MRLFLWFSNTVGFEACKTWQKQITRTSTSTECICLCLSYFSSDHVLVIFYYTSHTILKVKFLPKNSILTNPTFSRVFHQIFFWQFFSWNQSCQQLKSPKSQHFHEFFTPKIDNFLGKSKLNFWTKMKISNSVYYL